VKRTTPWLAYTMSLVNDCQTGGVLLTLTRPSHVASEIRHPCRLRRRSAKEHSVGWRKEFNNQAADILSHSLPMALPAALFVMQQACHAAPSRNHVLVCRPVLHAVNLIAP